MPPPEEEPSEEEDEEEEEQLRPVKAPRLAAAALRLWAARPPMALGVRAAAALAAASGAVALVLGALVAVPEPQQVLEAEQ